MFCHIYAEICVVKTGLVWLWLWQCRMKLAKIEHYILREYMGLIILTDAFIDYEFLDVMSPYPTFQNEPGDKVILSLQCLSCVNIGI